MSKLQAVLDEYLAVRRALGYKLRDPGLLLQQFVEFAEQASAAYITTDLALKWATQPTRARQTWWAMRLGVVRRFAQYCSCHDPRDTGATAGSASLSFPSSVAVHLSGPANHSFARGSAAAALHGGAASSHLRHTFRLICHRRSADQRAATSRS